MNTNKILMKMNLQHHAGGAGAPEEGLTHGNSFNAVRAREMDFVTQFTETWKKWQEIMRIIKPVEKAAKTELVSYTASVEEVAAQVEAGAVVGLTEVKLKRAAHRVMDIQKFRKAVPVEDVVKYGATVAVQRTDRAFRNKLFKNTQKEFYEFIKDGRLVGSRTSWQRALSTSKYSLQNYLDKQEVDYNGIVGFANLMDYEEYIGTKEITMQTLQGMNYIQNFMGYDVLWLLSDDFIPRKTVISTTFDNIIMYFTNPASSDIKTLGLDFTVDPELGLIGFHANGDYTRFTGETQAFKDIVLWADRLDAVCVVTVGSSDVEPVVTDITIPEDEAAEMTEEQKEEYKEAANHIKPKAKA